MAIGLIGIGCSRKLADPVMLNAWRGQWVLMHTSQQAVPIQFFELRGGKAPIVLCIHAISDSVLAYNGKYLFLLYRIPPILAAHHNLTVLSPSLYTCVATGKCKPQKADADSENVRNISLI